MLKILESFNPRITIVAARYPQKPMRTTQQLSIPLKQSQLGLVMIATVVQAVRTTSTRTDVLFPSTNVSGCETYRGTSPALPSWDCWSLPTKPIMTLPQAQEERNAKQVISHVESRSRGDSSQNAKLQRIGVREMES
jgi:hypothetical protein